MIKQSNSVWYQTEAVDVQFFDPTSTFLTKIFFCAQKAQFSVKGLGRWLKGLDDMLFDFLYLLILKWEGRKKSFLSKNVANFKFNFGSVKIYNSIVEKK